MRTPSHSDAREKRRRMVHTKDDLKTQAKRLRSQLQRLGLQMTHGQCLDLLARQMGHRDWNTLAAQCDVPSPTPPAVGSRVRGRYLGQPFSGVVRGLNALVSEGHWRITLAFDAPVDVVRSEHFSSLRRRVTAVVDAQGTAFRHTSDGTPHLELSAVAQ